MLLKGFASSINIKTDGSVF